MKTFYKFLFEEEKSIENKIIDFFRKNPNPLDKMVHAFANDEGIDEHKFEEIIYKLFSNYVSIGKNRNKKDSEFDSKELKLGINVEPKIEVKAKIKEELEEPKIEVKITETQIKPKKISKIFE